MVGRADALATDLHDPAGVLLGVDELLPLLPELDHRLLAVDVLARRQCLHRDGHVPVIGSGDDHCVHVGPRKDLLVLASGDDLVTEDFLGPSQPAVVEVGHGHELHSRRLQGGPGVRIALDTQADGGQAHPLAGGDGRRVLRLEEVDGG